jgi:hypothetical protein
MALFQPFSDGDLLQNNGHGMTMTDIMMDKIKEFIEGVVDNMSIFANVDCYNKIYTIYYTKYKKMGNHGNAY